MIVCTTGAVGLKETIDRLSVVQFAGFNIVQALGLTTPPMISPKSKNKNDKKLAEASQKFHSLIKSGKPPSPRLMNLIAFRAQQASFTLAHQYGLADADYKYFRERGWIDDERRYYTDVKVNPLKNLIAWLLGKMARRNMSKELQESAQASNGPK